MEMAIFSLKYPLLLCHSCARLYPYSFNFVTGYKFRHSHLLRRDRMMLRSETREHWTFRLITIRCSLFLCSAAVLRNPSFSLIVFIDFREFHVEQRYFLHPTRGFIRVTFFFNLVSSYSLGSCMKALLKLVFPTFEVCSLMMTVVPSEATVTFFVISLTSFSCRQENSSISGISECY